MLATSLRSEPRGRPLLQLQQQHRGRCYSRTAVGFGRGRARAQRGDFVAVPASRLPHLLPVATAATAPAAAAAAATATSAPTLPFRSSRPHCHTPLPCQRLQPCRCLRPDTSGSHGGGGKGCGAFGVAEALAGLQQVLSKHAHNPLSLYGYLFEVHVWATYNFDAVAKGLPYRAQRYADGRGGDVDVRVYDVHRPHVTLHRAQLKITGKHLFSCRYGDMDRVTTTQHAHSANGVCAHDALSYGGAASLPVSLCELRRLATQPQARLRELQAEVRRRHAQQRQQQLLQPQKQLQCAPPGWVQLAFTLLSWLRRWG